MRKLWATTALTPEGWKDSVSIVIGSNGKIARVKADQPPDGELYSVLLPAPVNLHSHSFQRLMAGLTETRGENTSDDFWSWRRLMYRFLESLTPEDIEATAAFVQMEMLEAGFPAVAEFHYLHHGKGGVAYDNPAEMSARIAAAACQSGIGLHLLPALYEQGGCDGRPLMPGQDRFGCNIDQFCALLDATETAVSSLPGDAGMGVAAHSLRAVSSESLALVEKARPELPFHMHLAEQPAEVEEIECAWGARPVQWVLNQCDVDSRWCLIHCTQMNDHETRALAHTGAIVGLCPITESNLGDGIFVGPTYLSVGGRFGIGSDSNVRISQAEEYRTLEYSQRLRDGRRAVLAMGHTSTGRALFERACVGGGLATGRNGGKIEAGAWADLMELNGDKTELRGLTGDTILDTWIFAGSDYLIQNVWSAGRHMVRGGQHVHRIAIEDRFRSVQDRLRHI